MSVQWLIKKDSDAPQTLEAAGVVDIVPGFKTNGVDSLTFTQVDDYLAAPAWPHLSVVALIMRETVGEDVTDTCVFVGTVEGVPRSAGDGESLSYTALGPSFALQLCDYSQEWSYTDDDDEPASQFEPTVVLGEDNNGQRLTSGGVINHALSYAVARGVPIDIGTIAAGITVPLDEKDNIKVWDAVVAMLRLTPDYAFWWDYNNQVGGQYVPAANLTAPDLMPVVTKALNNEDATEVEFVPRYDIQVPGILIIYRWSGSIDGRQVKRRRSDTAGDADSPRRVTLVYDLEGRQITTQSQEVEVEAYPQDWNSTAGKAFVAEKIPWLSQLDLDDWSVTDWYSDIDSGRLHYLVSGSVPSWTGKEVEQETWTVEVDYVVKSDATSHVLDTGKKKLTFTVGSTNAESTTYRRVSAYTAGEAAPQNLASDLFASWNRLHYDGTVTFMESECSFDLRPGKRLSCTGGMAEWETMSAIIQDVTHNIAAGTTTVRVGTCGRLEADSLMAIFRSIHGRRHSYSAADRDNADASDGNLVEGPTGTLNDTVADGTPASVRTRFAVEAADDDANTHLVDINPAAVVFAAAGNKAPQTVQLREMVIPYMSGSALKAKLAQVLCGSVYGDEIDLGGLPAGHSANQVLGTNGSNALAWLSTTELTWS